MLQQQLQISVEQAKRWAGLPFRVRLQADRKFADSPNGQYALALSLNVLSRFHPIVTDLDIFVDSSLQLKTSIPLLQGGSLEASLSHLVDRLGSPVRTSFNPQASKCDALLSVGNTDSAHEFKITIASDGWNAFVAKDDLSSIPSSNVGNPIGAYVSACLGSGEIFKRAFCLKGDTLLGARTAYDPRHRVKRLEGTLSFSALDYGINSDHSPNPSLPEIVDVGDVCIAGVGAGGGACAYSLASVSQVVGHLILIDPDEVRISNLNRYVYALKADGAESVSKVFAAAKLFGSRRVAVTAFAGPYLDFIKTWKQGFGDLVISTVDTAQARRDIQWDIPRIILDAASTGTEYYVMRVDLGEGPCLECTHEPSEDSLEAFLSRIIGLSSEEILELRRGNGRFTSNHIAKMRSACQSNAIPVPQIGEVFSDWLANHCGEMKLQSQHLTVPLPHATIMPGILLAGEVIKERYFPAYRISNTFFHDVFSMPNKSYGYHNARRPSCQFCGDASVMNRYHQKYFQGNPKTLT
jgi:hypothetical protein